MMTEQHAVALLRQMREELHEELRRIMPGSKLAQAKTAPPGRIGVLEQRIAALDVIYVMLTSGVYRTIIETPRRE